MNDFHAREFLDAMREIREMQKETNHILLKLADKLDRLDGKMTVIQELAEDAKWEK